MEEKVNRQVIEAKFSELLAKSDNEINTFEMCSEWGEGLNDSTIDKVERTLDGDIRFYYNENTGDYGHIGHFKVKELEAFYDAILEWNKSQEDYKRSCHEETLIEISHQLYDYIYAISGNDTYEAISRIKMLSVEFDELWQSCDQTENDYLMMIDEFCQNYIRNPK
jgi:hypothetical protein